MDPGRGIVVILLIAQLSVGATQAAQKPEHAGAKEARVQVEMRNVMYHFTEQITTHIEELKGELIPAKPGGIPVFDDKESFTLAIHSAEISITTSALADVLNQYVFGAKDAPLKALELAIEGDRLKIKGRLHSKGDIPFETQGTMAVTPEGEIRIHTEKMKAAHLPVKGLMDLLDVKIADLINTKKIEGIRIDKDDLLLNPEKILPPPRIEGHVTGVRFRGNEIVQQFGSGKPGKASQPGNYMAYRGAELRFGKLTMTDTDMVLFDMDPKDPFDFYLDRYKDQLVAGYTKTTPAFGLRVFMRDIGKLGGGGRQHGRGAALP